MWSVLVFEEIAAVCSNSVSMDIRITVYVLLRPTGLLYIALTNDHEYLKVMAPLALLIGLNL